MSNIIKDQIDKIKEDKQENEKLKADMEFLKGAYDNLSQNP